MRPQVHQSSGPPTRATDRDQRLAVTLDGDRQVLAVEVLDVRAVRTSRALADAVQEAVVMAEVQRDLDADPGLAGSVPERPTAPVVVTPPRGMVTREASLQRRAVHAPRSRATGTGCSANGFVRIQRSPVGAIVAVDVDEAWLSVARPAHLAAAIEQAARFDLGEAA